MHQNLKYFYTSGVLAFVVYILLIFFFLLIFLNKKETTRYVMKNDTQYDQIAIEAVLEDMKPILEKPQIKEPMQYQIPNIEEKNLQEENEILPRLKDLFSDIPDLNNEHRDDASKKSKRLEQQRRLQEEKRIQEQQEAIWSIKKNLTHIKRVLRDTNANINIRTEVLPNQDNGLYDEWIAKIYKILYENWSFIFYQDATVTALVNITDTGKFSYRILKYSLYNEYNVGVVEILDSLKYKQFPPYPNGSSINIEVNFKAKVMDD